MLRRIVGTTASGGFLTALLAEGWAGVAVAVGLILVLTVAVCWIVADAERPARLALLLTAWRREPTVHLSDVDATTSSAPERDPGANRVPAPAAR